MHNQLIKPKELIVFEYLKGRMPFSTEQRNKMQNLQRGFRGEQLFCKLLEENVKHNFIPLYDILLNHQGNFFQIDCLLILQREIILLEIKNYQGEFLLQDDHLFSITAGKKYRNPLHQLQRSDIQLRELLLQHQINLPLTSYILFINQSFTLFQADQHPNIILPTQLHSFINKLNNISSTIMEDHVKIAEILSRLHQRESPYEQIPEYNAFQLKKGLLCKNCRIPVRKMKKSQMFCSSCKRNETMEAAVMRNANEFHTLLPYEKITTKHIYDWCGAVLSKSTIKRVLSRNLRFIDKNRYSYYTFD